VKGSLRPRRALLFCPAIDRGKVAKAAALGADAVILDLEDSIAPSRKTEARRAAVGALGEIDFGRSERLVRVNPIEGGLGQEDLLVTGEAARPPDGYVLPKVESADSIRTASRLLGTIEKKRRLADGTLKILAIIETARGVVRLGEIAGSGARLEALIFGAEDLCGDLGGVRSREGREVLYARSALAIHCAAERLQAIDTVFVDLLDEAGLLADTHEALGMGYSGKLAIHPKQIAPILSVFTPNSEEVAAARRIVREHRRHQAAGSGVFALDGKMIDMPMVRAAERVLDRAGVASPQDCGREPPARKPRRRSR
jgi:citrate lyase beta subunit